MRDSIQRLESLRRRIHFNNVLIGGLAVFATLALNYGSFQTIRNYQVICNEEVNRIKLAIRQAGERYNPEKDGSLDEFLQTAISSVDNIHYIKVRSTPDGKQLKANKVHLMQYVTSLFKDYETSAEYARTVISDPERRPIFLGLGGLVIAIALGSASALNTNRLKEEFFEELEFKEKQDKLYADRQKTKT